MSTDTTTMIERGYESSDRVRVYSYTRRSYRGGDRDGRVYYCSPPSETTETTVITVRPRNCGTYHYWHEGRCVDARGE